MTTATAAPPEVLLTAEEYAALPDGGRHTELVRGRVIEMPQPTFRHGVLCNRVGRLLGNFVEERGLGWVLNNDSGVVTERDPDTVRGADIAYFSFAKIPKGQEPEKYPSVAPELVFEVRSPSDRWSAVGAKADEYLTAGVRVVCVLDPDTESVGVYTADEFPRRLTADDELTLPEVFPDFRVPVRRFFD
ncbi:MAG: Uma2 family endonuclease [Gemmataceae bacterium]|nr:Uma2 family endonuclease [Gemmataceae bacterium]